MSRQLVVTPHQETLLCKAYMQEKYFILVGVSHWKNKMFYNYFKTIFITLILNSSVMNASRLSLFSKLHYSFYKLCSLVFCFQVQFLAINEIYLLKANWELMKLLLIEKKIRSVSISLSMIDVGTFSGKCFLRSALNYFYKQLHLAVLRGSEYASEDGCK